MRNDKARPSFNETTSAQKAEAEWKELEWRFSELRDVVENCRLETREEAVGVQIPGGGKRKHKKWKPTTSEWHDEEIGFPVRAWNLVPYIDALDQTMLHDRLEAARRLIPELRGHFAERKMTLSFLRAWGLFCEYAGAINLVYLSEPNVGHARSAVGGARDNLDRHRVWFAHYYLRSFEQHRNNERARYDVQRLVNAKLHELKKANEDAELAEWLERFLTPKAEDEKVSDPEDEKVPDPEDEERPLTREFQRELSKAKMQVLVNEPTEGLPPLNWDFPFPTP